MAPADAVIGWVDGATGAGMVNTFYITSEQLKRMSKKIVFRLHIFCSNLLRFVIIKSSSRK